VARSAFAQEALDALSVVSDFEQPVIARALATTSANNKLVCFFTSAPFRGVELDIESVAKRNEGLALVSSCEHHAFAGLLLLG
jgi:hypothetical protein